MVALQSPLFPVAPKSSTGRDPARKSLAIAIVALLALTSGVPASADSGPTVSGLTDGLLDAEPEPAASPNEGGIHFVENLGQFPNHVRFQVVGAEAATWITDRGVAMLLTRATSPADLEAYSVLLDFEGAGTPTTTASGLLSSTSNYYLGDDPGQWFTGARHYERVLQEGVWPGIDVAWYADAQGLKFDAIVHPGADPAQVRFLVDGAESIRLDTDGRLVLQTPLGDIVQDVPYTYQGSGEDVREVANGYTVAGDRISFDVGAYDPTKDLVIDPLVLVQSGSLSGNGQTRAMDVSVDSNDYSFVTGWTSSSSGFPTQSGYQQSLAGLIDAFLTKYTSSGSLAWSTYLGGSSYDYGHGVTPYSGGAAIVGETESTDFPVLNPWQSSNAGGTDAFIAVFGNSGSLSWSSYRGGSGADTATSIEFSGGTHAVVTGATTSTNFPTNNAFQSSNAGQWDLFAMRLSLSSRSISYSTYYGGPSADYANDVAVDGSGNAFLTGRAGYDFPTHNGYQNTRPGIDYAAFVVKLTSTGSRVYSTYLGGFDWDEGNGIDVDSSGNAIVVGHTSSNDFPMLNAYDSTFSGGHESPHGFVTKLSSTGSSLVYSTYLGEPRTYVYDVAVDAGGNAVITGETLDGFPTLKAYDSTFNGQSDAFLAKFTGSGGLSYGTYYGFSGTDSGNGVGLDSTDVPVIAGNLNGYSTGFWAKFLLDETTPTITGNPQTWSWRNTIPTLSGVTWQDSGSGLDYVYYTVGSTSGASDIQGLSSIPGQPSYGQTSPYSPTWTPASLAQGSNYFNTRAEDRAAHVLETSGTYRVDYDSVDPTVVSTNCQFIGWFNALPTLDSVVFQDVTSGLKDNAQYKIDASELVQDWTLLPVQPTPGQTSEWEPSWTPPTLAEGSNTISIDIEDMTGNQPFPWCAYRAGFDTQAEDILNPEVLSAEGGTALAQDAWQTDSTPYFDWDVSTSTSPLAGFVHTLSTSSTASPGTGTPTLTDSLLDRSADPLADGAWHFRVRAKDEAGNAGPTTSPVVLKVDTTAPAASGATVVTPWTNTNPTLSGVCIQDPHAGLDASATYRVGSTPGGSDVRTDTAMPSQPTDGQTTSWCPSFQVQDGQGLLVQGTNHVTIDVQDELGLQTSTDAYQVRFDDVGDAVSVTPKASATGATLPEASWQSDNTPYFTWAAPSSTSPVAGYTYTLSQDPGAAPNGVVDTTLTHVEPAPLADGVWYFRAAAVDEAGNVGPVDSVTLYVDTEGIIVTGDPVVTPWVNTNPVLSGVCFQDDTAGLEDNAQYWMGPTAGSTSYKAPTTMPTQPAQGQTTQWCPSFSVDGTALGQGVNHVTIRTDDGAGHTEDANAYQVRYDDVADPVSLAARTHAGGPTIPSNAWQEDNTPFFEWSASSTSPVVGYSTTFSQSVSATPDTTVDTTGTSHDVTTPLADGTWYFRVRAADDAGNWGSHSTFTLNIDTSDLVATGAPVVTDWTNTNPTLSGVCYQDAGSGLDDDAVYWLGSSPGASDVKPATTMPVQPARGQTSPWCPSFQVDGDSLLQGSTFVTVQVEDQGGAVLATPSYEVRFDDVQDAVVDLKALSGPGGSVLPEATWQTDDTPFFDWGDSASVSPVAGYSYVLSNVQSSVDSTVDTTGTSLDPGALADGTWYLSLRAVDEAGNAGPIERFHLRVDTADPTSTGAPVEHDWTNASPTLTGVCFQDETSGLLDNAQYRVGATPGTGTWTPVPVQPTAGSTASWCPSFTVPEESLVQGSNHVDLRVEDQAGHSLVVAAYLVRFDNVADPVQGLQAYTEAGGTAHPEASWVQDRSPFFDWSAPGTSPVAGYSLTWSETATAPDGVVDQAAAGYAAGMGTSVSANGKWSFQVLAVDAAGNVGPVSAFAYWLDDKGPTIGAIGSSTHPSALNYYSRTTVQTRLDFPTDWDGSGIAGYAHEFLAPGESTSDLTSKPTTTDTSYEFQDVGPFGQYRFRAQAVDNLGQWGPVRTKNIHVDTIAPEIEAVAPLPETESVQPDQPVRVRYEDLDKVLGVPKDPLQQETKVDPETVQFFVDGIDMRATWEDVCAPKGPVESCRLEVTSDGIDYEPLVPWTDGRHDVYVHVRDEVVLANAASLEWSWTQKATGFLDGDGDALPDTVETVACNDPLVRVALETIGSCDGDDFDAGFTATVPTLAEPGPDADGDGAPAHVRVHYTDVTYDPGADPPVTTAPAPPQDLPVDGDDGDPSTPVQSRFTFSVPRDIRPGPDADGDGFPATLAVEWYQVTLDRRPGHELVTVERDPSLDQVVPVDSAPVGDDGDPSQPLPEAVTITVASNVRAGPDEDLDGVPASATVEYTDVTVTRGGGVATTRNKAADQTHPVDGDDADPETPVRSTWVLEGVPLWAGFGPDGDGDGIPARAEVQTHRVTVDRTSQQPVTSQRTPEQDPVLPPIDPDDEDPDDPAPGLDGDGDGVPDAAEPVFCMRDNSALRSDGSCPDSDEDWVPPTPEDVIADVLWILGDPA